ncbi:MAG: AAA family ATPase [Chloroflexi bacterium]|nr:AAA family ATPase [Chloroflexota bacterium]MCY4247438.1 AAA family ATPase [Chloroflexota bacterium]
MFDHEIRLNQDSRISIIHGPNGIGKTVLMKMINGLFTSNYGVFLSIPFGSFSVELSSGERVCIEGNYTELETRDAAEGDRDSDPIEESLVLRYFDSNGSNEQTYNPKPTRQGLARVRELAESKPELSSIGSTRWENILTGDVLTIEEVIAAYDFQVYLYNEPKWMKDIKRSTRTRLIQAQRLQDPEPTRPLGFSAYLSSRRRRASSAPKATVVRYSEEIAKEIGNAMAEYGQESQIRDRSFPKRLIESDGTELIAQDNLQEKLDELEKKTAKLIKLGLFEDKDVPEIPKLDDTTQNNLTDVLSIYVQDIEAKLSKVDAISRQLEILIAIINNRFMCKTLEIDKRKGFIFKDNKGNEIPKTSLSSGEQHELILIYQLLFHVEHNSLIMIDEPELSLHVDWQERFLDDLRDVIAFRHFDLLIATHSPTLVDDKWEWVVGLRYPEGVC